MALDEEEVGRKDGWRCNLASILPSVGKRMLNRIRQEPSDNSLSILTQ